MAGRRPFRETTIWLERGPNATRRARAELDGFAPELRQAARDDARLVVSELVSNAVKHGRGRVGLSLALDRRGTLSGYVIDDGDGFEPPAERPSEAAAPGGWGLWLVDDLTHRWGIRRDTTRVWFEMPRGLARGAV